MTIGTNDGTRVLLAAPRTPARARLADSLRSRRLDTVETAPGTDLQRLARPGDVLVLDTDGLDDDHTTTMLAELARASIATIVISSDPSVRRTVVLLEAGADDRVAKPLSLDELVARIHSVRRRSATRTGTATPVRSSERVQADELELNLAARSAVLSGRPVALTSTEWRLLEELVRNAGTVLGHTHLATAVWGKAQPTDTRALRVHISNLRRKLAGPGTALIGTDHGLGYRWKGPAPEPS